MERVPLILQSSVVVHGSVVRRLCGSAIAQQGHFQMLADGLFHEPWHGDRRIFFSSVIWVHPPLNQVGALQFLVCIPLGSSALVRDTYHMRRKMMEASHVATLQ